MRLEDLPSEWTYSDEETTEAYDDIDEDGFCGTDGPLIRPQEYAIAAFSRLGGDVILGHIVAAFAPADSTAAFACLRDALLTIAGDLSRQNGLRGVTVRTSSLDVPELGDQSFSFRLEVVGARADSTDLALAMVRRSEVVSVLIQVTDDPPPAGIDVETLTALVPIVDGRLVSVLGSRKRSVR